MYANCICLALSFYHHNRLLVGWLVGWFSGWLVDVVHMTCMCQSSSVYVSVKIMAVLGQGQVQDHGKEDIFHITNVEGALRL